MRKSILLLFAIFILTPTVYCQSYVMMTYNIRYDNPDDGPDNWKHRKKDMVRFINRISPLVLGIQEGMGHQVAYLNEHLKDYDFIGVGRDDGKTEGEYCAIFYQSNQLKLIKSGTFWLSETPSAVSTGWDAALPRICTYGLFEEVDSKERFWVFNTHFDHKGVLARENSAALLVNQIPSINRENLPLVLMGDFNATPLEMPITTINSVYDDCLEKTTSEPKGPTGTVNGFTKVNNSRRIDFIFCSGFSTQSLEHIEAKTSRNRHLSDHLPVVATLSVNH